MSHSFLRRMNNLEVRSEHEIEKFIIVISVINRCEGPQKCLHQLSTYGADLQK